MDWHAVTDAFDKARSLPHGERSGFLRQYFAGDEELQREAESLLQSYQESGDFMEEPAVAQSDGELLDSLPGALIGTRLGVFQITRLIGEGGMGEVYEGERADGEFRQRVAIKIVREDWLDRRRHDRLRAERQILSDLSHPHIARLFDGGATDTGAPYLVMELIDGEPIDRYCDSRRLDIAQRLELFGKVCEAVEHANRQNVIHCDIKPGNLLVTPDGTPKLLDFGISRLLSAGPQTTQNCLATPEYASPEQREGRPITPATDVYALGVVLRKLAGAEPLLSAVIARATHPLPLKRYPSAAALGDAARRSATSRWSRRGVIAGLTGAGAMLGAGGLTWRYFRRSVLSGSEALAVMRIENRTGDKDLDWADRGIADLLASNFAQAGGFEVISTTQSRELLERLGNNQRQAAEAAHAAYYVNGDLLRLGRGLRLNLRVEQTSTGRILFAEKFDGDSPQAIISLADQGSSAILAELRASTYAAPSSARALSSNPDALRLYEQGCAYDENSGPVEAQESFLRAIQIDPKFAMAYFRLGLGEKHNHPLALSYLDRANELAKQLALPPRERQLMDGYRLWEVGRMTESIAVLCETARQNPRDAEVRTMLTGSYYYQDPLTGLKFGEEALAIDPGSRTALRETAFVAASIGRFSQAMTFANRYLATQKPGDSGGYIGFGDVFSLFGRFDEALAAYQKVHGDLRLASFRIAVTLVHKGDFDRAESGLKEMIGRHIGGIAMGKCLGYLADVQVGRGSLDAAHTWLEQGVHAYIDYPWFGGTLLLNAAQLYLEQQRPEAVLELAALFSGHPWSPGVRAVALLATGKTADAESSLAEIHTSVGAFLGDFMGARYEELYRILGAFYRGEHEKVAVMASLAPPRLWNFFALAAGRSNLALGKLEAAERHLNFARRAQLSFSTVGLGSAHNFLTFLLSEFYLGQLAARRGQKEEVRRKCEFFLKHFSHSTARLPQIAEARATLQTL
jgi:serine/threonine protein kinase